MSTWQGLVDLIFSWGILLLTELLPAPFSELAFLNRLLSVLVHFTANLSPSVWIHLIIVAEDEPFNEPRCLWPPNLVRNCLLMLRLCTCFIRAFDTGRNAVNSPLISGMAEANANENQLVSGSKHHSFLGFGLISSLLQVTCQLVKLLLEARKIKLLETDKPAISRDLYRELEAWLSDTAAWMPLLTYRQAELD
ncbi:unnamed protein product [Protopolystoma xenopodis]|uniref:Uncharacterized protein n=1 Tax=Protopolystoma xenopodis TaxID=117903 RepID=A0A448WEP8_9PLAT|nr:unnamed protein product [Protopolystoma xenopodis]